MVLSIGLGACSNADANTDLEGRIADLEAELLQATSTTPAPAPATTSSTSLATTIEDPLDPELVRERFEYAMADAMATSLALLEREPELVTVFPGAGTSYWLFDLEPGWSFDIERTDSIISASEGCLRSMRSCFRTRGHGQRAAQHYLYPGR